MSADRPVIYCGSKFKIVFARDSTGSCPAQVFFDACSSQDKARLMHLFRILSETELGAPKNPEKFGVPDNGLFEFKSFQIRMPFSYARREKGLVLISHGFVKKRDKTSPAEIERAKRILAEDDRASKVLSIAAHNRKKRP